MDPNTMLGGLLAAVGVTDLVLAKVLADKLPPIGRQVLTLGGVAFIVLGALAVYGILRIL